MKKLIVLSLVIAGVLSLRCSDNKTRTKGVKAKDLQANEIKAFCIDFNSAHGNFAEPGLWTNSSPNEQVGWYKDLGVNTIQTFCVSTNGYAWYKSDVVPEQPGLKTDFLRDVVQTGHEEGLNVMGYFCIGANKRWALEHPDESYGHPYRPHIPFTNNYRNYLDAAIREVVTTTKIDGFMIDWLWQPDRSAMNGKWLESEKNLYEELMDEKFPGEDNLSGESYNTYSRAAIEKCWDVIYMAAKESNPDCVIWLSCNNTKHPHIVNSKIFKQIDWLMNEAGEIEGVTSLKEMIGSHTKLLTCLAVWNGQEPANAMSEANKSGIGVYGYVKANPDLQSEVIPPVQEMLSQPVSKLSGSERILGVIARLFNGHPLEYLKE
jgi:uncharacterized lipoprotein YddW (UPF0748 family)